MDFKALEKMFDITAPEMAEITEISQSMYYAVRTGKRALSEPKRREALMRLAQHLDFQGRGGCLKLAFETADEMEKLVERVA